jgi:SAM-dependent methyltransferase
VLLRTVLEPHIGTPDRVLDVGSADGPSVGWLGTHPQTTSLDLDPVGLERGGVCGSALALPFCDESFDVVAAFDVLEHCEPERRALMEMWRVLRPGGRLLLAVPAYEWAWTQFDVDAGHYRRYSRRTLVQSVEAAGFSVRRATHVFAGTFPIFALERMAKRFWTRSGGSGPLPQVSPFQRNVLMGLCRLDGQALKRMDLPFGSSVVVAATKADIGVPSGGRKGTDNRS